MVEATVETLLDQIESGSRRPRKSAIAGRLVVRSSARLPEGWRDGAEGPWAGDPSLKWPSGRGHAEVPE
jgi:hypothetical protein